MPEMTGFEKFFVNRRGVRSYRKMLDRMESTGQFGLPPSSQVLELGAGNGGLSLLVAERYHPARVCVTDYDPAQVAIAKQHIESVFRSTPPSMEVARGDATHLEYGDGSFDLVMAHHVLHHLGPTPAILQGLDEIARVLRPGGRLLYAEMFHKQEIRDHLAKCGFTTLYHERAWRFFNTADVVLARRGSPTPT